MTSESLSFSNPHEELAYLRSKVLEAEKKLDRFGGGDREAVVRETISQFKSDASHDQGDRGTVAEKHALELMDKSRQVELEDMMRLTESRGILYSLSVAEKLKDWKLEDDFHDYLVNLVNQGLSVRGMKEKDSLYKAVHMTLYEVVLPKLHKDAKKPLGELLKGMEQLYAGFLSLVEAKKTESN